jgi:hypothetical protein
MQTTTQTVRLDSLALITGVGGPLEAVSVKPITGPITPTDETTFAEANALAATFTGSAAILIVWSDPAIAPNRQPFQESQLLLWICTADPAAPESIYGVMYYNGTDLIGIDLFPAPVLIEQAYDSVQWIASAP